MTDLSVAPASAPQTAGGRMKRKAKKRSSFLRIFAVTAFVMLILFGFAASFFLWTPAGKKLRDMAADSLITTQHRYLANYLIGEREVNRRVEAYWERFDDYAKVPVHETPVPPSGTSSLSGSGAASAADQKPLVSVEPIEGKGYKGYILAVSDPKKLRVAVPAKVGMGERVSSMVKRTGAVAGVNGGGFIDPEGKGNGFQPAGIVMSGGRVFYRDSATITPIHVIAIDRDGMMIAGKYSPAELEAMHVSEAVSFAPRFIADGVGLIKSRADGWGIAPRTCMAQTKDGTILFAIIDGRQPGYSLGATLYDVQELLLARGAIIAANLDGGSSTVLVKDNRIVNRPASEYGERYLPTAWLVYDDPQKAGIANIWEGMDINKIDPSKWTK